ncbi:MAG: carbohydrate ABC transporter permease [Spirochaetes bacterium]|nr:carbohydrate ABC transporter permease [Spirochaetota bacterium]
MVKRRSSGHTLLWKASRTLKYLVLFGVSLIFIYPFYYVFVLATRERANMFKVPPPFWFGHGIGNNYSSLLKNLPFWRNMLNSTGIAVLATFTTLFFCTMAGFAFAKYKFKGKNFLFNFILATLAIPQLLGIIPFFKMMVWFNWLNTWFPLFIPTMANAFGIFLMRQYLNSSVPLDLLDAARIDGIGEFKILFKVVFPLAKPALAVLGISTFIGSWNNFFGALVILRDKRAYTIPVALSSLLGVHNIDFGAIMMGTALSLVPLLVIFLFFSKKIISNLLAGSLKGVAR